ncbi:MAG: alpha/beta fold hydrolase [Pseudomonadota bacterium]
MSFSTIQSFAPLRTEPVGFQRFWDETMADLSKVDPSPIAYDPASVGGTEFTEIAFTSLDNVKILGYLIRQPNTAPLIVHTHGYNDQYCVMDEWAAKGFHVMGLDLRGFGRSEFPVHEDGYVLTGLESQHSSILRGAVCDLIQALEASRTLFGDAITKTVLYGFSFGGAMATMAGALSQHPDLIVVGQPTLGWHSERRRVSLAGSTKELNEFLHHHPALEGRVVETLSYFESMHFAARISKPILMGVGLDDDVVPSRTVLAIFNHLASAQKELRLLPVSHSHDPRENLWRQFDEEWLTNAKSGGLNGFGAPDRQVRTIMSE